MKFGISGAQPLEVFAQTLENAWIEHAEIMLAPEFLRHSEASALLFFIGLELRERSSHMQKGNHFAKHCCTRRNDFSCWGFIYF
jgi:hypothetical protein